MKSVLCCKFIYTAVTCFPLQFLSHQIDRSSNFHIMASVNYKELVSISISTSVALKKVARFFNHLRSFVKIDTQQFIRSPIDNRTYVRFEGTKVPKGERESIEGNTISRADSSTA